MANLEAPLVDIDTTAPFLPDDFKPVSIEVEEKVLEDFENDDLTQVDQTQNDGGADGNTALATESANHIFSRKLQTHSRAVAAPPSAPVQSKPPKVPEGSPAWAQKDSLPPVEAAGHVPGIIMFMTLEIPATDSVAVTKYGIVAYDPFVKKEWTITDVVKRYKGKQFPLPYYETFTAKGLGKNRAPQYQSANHKEKEPPTYYAGVFGSTAIKSKHIAGKLAAPWYYKDVDNSPIKEGFSLTYWNDGEVEKKHVYGVFTGPIHERFSSETRTKIMPLFVASSTQHVMEIKDDGDDELKVYVDFYAMHDGPLKK